MDCSANIYNSSAALIYIFLGTDYYLSLQIFDCSGIGCTNSKIGCVPNWNIVETLTLTYLAFIYDGMLCGSISKLCNIQILIFYLGIAITFVDTVYLQLEIWKMARLRHLCLNGSASPNSSVAQIDGVSSIILESLETLSEVTNLKLSKEFLKMILNVENLQISYHLYSNLESWPIFLTILSLYISLKHWNASLIPCNLHYFWILPQTLLFHSSLKVWL